MMLNGERCPLSDNRDRTLSDGDELYLLAPIAGG
jgi:molybdopterin converting factor small subunit